MKNTREAFYLPFKKVYWKPETNPSYALFIYIVMEHLIRANVLACVVQCETMLEEFEEVVEDWYFHHQDQRLESFLCENQVLKTSEQGGRRGESGAGSLHKLSYAALIVFRSLQTLNVLTV